MSRAPAQEPRLTLLYDRDCAFCAWTAVQLRALDRDHRVGLVPLQEATGDGARPDLVGVASQAVLGERIHAVTGDGEVLTGARAILGALEALPGGWLLRPWSRLADLTGVAELGYDLIARRRDRLARLVGARSADDPLCPRPILDPAPSSSRHDAATRPAAPGSGLRARLADTHPTIPAGGREG